ncbi:MAG: guanine deaminase, partial [Proteobacteria bacterium]|nr:guanine deaminase [Pseudomonadota bacterium]
MSDHRCDFIPDGMLVVSGTVGQSRIVELMPVSKAQKKYKKEMSEKNVTDFGNSVILPGFFDMHFHWVQDEVRTMPKDSLLQWLERHTFPTEAKFSDVRYAKAKARTFF